LSKDTGLEWFVSLAAPIDPAGERSMLCKSFANRFLALWLLTPACGLLAGCEDSGLSPVSTRSLAPIPAKTAAAMEALGSSKEGPVLIRSYKKEAEFEIWKMKADGHYSYLKSFPLCRWSGQLGPKVREGDRQVPEGFYAITPAHMNPQSAYYLSFDIGYPNAYDRAKGHTGGSIMVHGACSSAGCFSMTDAQIAEIYAIAREAFAGGQPAIQMQSYPFRMTAENLAKYRLDPNIGFWKQLKEGSDNFEVTKRDVAVGVCDRRYVFNAAPADGSQFNPSGPCPALKYDEDVHKQVLARRAHDEAKIAELAAQGVHAIKTVYADGGQHPDFASLASFASRPEALAKGPVDIDIDDPKTKKAKGSASAKKTASKQAVAKAEAAPAPAAASEPVAVADAPEAAKPEYVSFFSRLWGAKPAEAKAEPPKDAPSSSAAAAPTEPAPASIPLPPKRKEPAASAAKPMEPKSAGAKAKSEKSVAAPAAAEPHAQLSPSVSPTVAMLRPLPAPAEQAQQ
jgi:murein L,D-transpeptidase YafK